MNSDRRRHSLDILIRNSDSRPIYQQIYAQIKNEIISGALKEGDTLPSIRSLAKDLRISVITTKRAYDELEKDGFLYTVAGKGCYVAPKDTALVREQHLREIEAHIRAILTLANPLGLSQTDLLTLFRTIAEEEEFD